MLPGRRPASSTGPGPADWKVMVAMRVLMRRAAILAAAAASALTAGMLAGAPASAQATSPHGRPAGAAVPRAATAPPMKIGVSPASTVQGSTGNALTFTVSATAAVSGKLSLAVPGAWTAPQRANSHSGGYVAVHRLTCTSAAPGGAIKKGVILLRFRCAKGTSFSVSYGGTAASGKVTAPWRAGKYKFTAKAKIGAAGYTLLAAQPVVTVQPVHLAVTGLPGSVSSGAAQQFSVTARDSAGDVVAGYRGTVKFTSADAQATLPAEYTFTATDEGTHTFSPGVTFRTAGSEQLTATDTAHAGITGSVSATVTPGAAVMLDVTGLSGSVTAGAPQSVVVTAVDAFGNTATGYAGKIHFTSSDADAALPADYSFTGPDQGSHTFSAGVTLVTTGSQIVIATDTATMSLSGSQTATVSAPSTDHVYWADNITGSIEAVPPGGGTPAILTSDQGFPAAVAVDGTSVYWADEAGGTIEKEPLDGDASPTILASGQSGPVAIAVDGTSVYWADETGGTIEKVPLDGGVSPTTLASGLSGPDAIAVDATSVYWTDHADGTIDKVPLDGGVSPTAIASGQSGPDAIAIDATSVYWADQSGDTIEKAPLDGSASPTAIASGQSGPVAIAVDATSVYWADETGGSIEKVPLDGGVSPTAIASGQSGPIAIAVDATSVYWIDQTGGSIEKVPLDGGVSPTILASGQSGPDAITLSP